MTHPTMSKHWRK